MLVNIRKNTVTMWNIGVEEPKPYGNIGQHITARASMMDDGLTLRKTDR